MARFFVVLWLGMLSRQFLQLLINCDVLDQIDREAKVLIMHVDKIELLVAREYLWLKQFFIMVYGSEDMVVYKRDPDFIMVFLRKFYYPSQKLVSQKQGRIVVIVLLQNLDLKSGIKLFITGLVYVDSSL